MKFAVYIVYDICKRMVGTRCRYLDYFLHFRGLESKRGNVKPSYLIEIHSEIATLFHILIHHGPNTGEIIMKFPVDIVYNICKEWRKSKAVILTTLCIFWSLESKRGNVKSLYLIEIHSEIVTLFHILVHCGPDTGEIVLKFSVHNICTRLERGPVAVILTASCILGRLEGNAVMSNHCV